jgi:hypothetical protein
MGMLTYMSIIKIQIGEAFWFKGNQNLVKDNHTLGQCHG